MYLVTYDNSDETTTLRTIIPEARPVLGDWLVQVRILHKRSGRGAGLRHRGPAGRNHADTQAGDGTRRGQDRPPRQAWVIGKAQNEPHLAPQATVCLLYTSDA